MLVGHVAVGFAAKRAAPSLSLGALVLAALLPDILWAGFLLAGIEHVTYGSGRGAANYLHADHIAFSHSLFANAVWAGILAAIYAITRRAPRGVWILFGTALSHWVLDWLSHRPDMPLLPGSNLRFGIGLWTSIPATLAVEGGLWLAAIVLYVRHSPAKTRGAAIGFWTGAAILTLLWHTNIAGPPPRDARFAPISTLVIFALTVAWARWADRSRSREPVSFGIAR